MISHVFFLWFACAAVLQAECVQPDGSILHVDPHSMEEVKTEAFLPKGEIVIGVTSGASTPDAYMEQVRDMIRGTDMCRYVLFVCATVCQESNYRYICQCRIIYKVSRTCYGLFWITSKCQVSG